jgi:hypothetical protein
MSLNSGPYERLREEDNGGMGRGTEYGNIMVKWKKVEMEKMKTEKENEER